MTNQTRRQDPYLQAVQRLGDPWGPRLAALEETVRQQVREVRLTRGQPPLFVCGQGTSPAWELGAAEAELCRPVTPAQLEGILQALCGWAVHTHQEEIRQGFVSLPGGHRAGLAGTAVIQDGKVTGLRELSSVVLRIARPPQEDRGLGLARQLFEGGLCSVLVAGAPGSGKTTLLRQLCRAVAGGGLGQRLAVAVVDERGELSAAGEQDLGEAAVVLTGWPKAEGILQAVRTLAPQVVFCDELGGRTEVQAVLSGLNAGAAAVASVHAGSWAELCRKPQFPLLCQGFDWVVLLEGPQHPGQVREILPLRKEMQADAADLRRGAAGNGQQPLGNGKQLAAGPAPSGAWVVSGTDRAAARAAGVQPGPSAYPAASGWVPAARARAL